MKPYVNITHCVLASIFILFHCHISLGQSSLNKIGLKQGPYSVGFQHYTKADRTRTYSRVYDFSNQKIPRPIPISIWYPSSQDSPNKAPLKIFDYMEILKEEEEWENRPNEQILNWFYYANNPANQAHLKEVTKSYLDLEESKGKFPVILYSPSFLASSVENFAMCEYLASEGFIVIASPSRGTETRWFGNNLAKEMETQARDVEFLIKEAGLISNSDLTKIAVMGFASGG